MVKRIALTKMGNILTRTSGLVFSLLKFAIEQGSEVCVPEGQDEIVGFHRWPDVFNSDGNQNLCGLLWTAYGR